MRVRVDDAHDARLRVVGHPTNFGGVRRSDASPVIGMYLILLSLVPPLLVLPGLGAAGRPAAVGGMCMLGWWILTRMVRSPDDGVPVVVAIRWALFIYMLVFVASMVAGLDRGLDGLEARSMYRALMVNMSFVGVAVVLIDGLPRRESVERVLRWAVALGAVGALVGVVQFVFRYDLAAAIRIPGLVSNQEQTSINTRGSGGYARVRGLARHPIEFGVVMAMLLPVSVHLAEYSLRPGWKRWIAPSLIAAAIPLSISRSGVLAVAVGMAVYAAGWTWRQRANALAFALAFLLAFQAVTPGLLGTLRSLFVNISNDNTVTGRTEDFAATAPFIQERPWLGRGAGTFVVERYRLLDNEYLGTLLERGWLGVGSLVLLFVVAGLTSHWLVRNSDDPATKSVSRALGANVAVALVVLATFDALSFPIYSGLLFVMIGCLGTLYRLEKETARPDGDDRRTPDVLSDSDARERIK